MGNNSLYILLHKEIMKPIFILLILAPITIFAQNNYGTIDQRLLKCVVYISKDEKRMGTGFLVSQKLVLKEKRTFLITNKHLLGTWNLCETTLIPNNSIDVVFYTKAELQPFRNTKITITENDGRLKRNVLPHANPKVDIVLIDITSQIKSELTGELPSFDISDLKEMDSLPSLLVGLGDPVFALGYPADTKSLKTNLPIAKAAYISSSLDGDMELIVKVSKDDCSDSVLCRSKIGGKIFLVDGNIIGGNSGGPIILGRQPVYATGGSIVTEDYKARGNVIVGIVSQGKPNTGINIIYGCDYIKELIKDYIRLYSLSLSNKP